MKLNIDPVRCVRCGLCQSVCIFNNISLDPEVHETETECFECGHCVSICPTGAINLKIYEDLNYDTRNKYKTDKLDVTYDEYIDVLNRHRSIRYFTKEDVTPQTYEKLFKCLDNTPTASNMQDLDIVVIKSDLYEFTKYIYDIIKTKSSDFLTIRNLAKYIENPDENQNTLLYTGRDIILLFSKNPQDTTIACGRIEITAQLMGLGGFYNGFIVMADEIDHEKLMEYFPEIDPSKHLSCAYIIGHPKIKFKRPLPPRKVNITYK
ncbi:nitroreductase family protein [Methanosphaera cuniculi]|uniref:nitroreductase family protein n=1 Tax=Methanosphaera cuniculi TaxID=1077256 RepID=UPI0026DB6812|nr:nitroreductase family protein [Methanosphaera cuniculi]